MQDNDKLIKEALDMLCDSKVIPVEKIETLTNEVDKLKKCLEKSSKEELQDLLNDIPESKIKDIKDIIFLNTEHNK